MSAVQRRVAQVGTQPAFGTLLVGVMRTLEDPDGQRYVVLRLRDEIRDERVRVDLGSSVVVPGDGVLTVEEVEPSTPQAGGWVALALEPEQP